MASIAVPRSVSPFPDFVIIGSAKSGTTNLAMHLARHPDICFSRAKEPEILRWELSDEKAHRCYAKLFSEARPGQTRGEGSTCYTGWSNWRANRREAELAPPPDPETAVATMMEEIGQTARRLARFAPHARIIYMVRHPVDRIYSQLHYNTRHAAAPVDFEDALRQDPRYVQVSHYAEILQLYLACFSREQFLFAQLDEVAKDLGGLLDRVQDFLGVPRAPGLTEEKVFTNEGKHHQLRRALSNRFRRIPGYSLVRRLVPRGGREWVFNQLKGSALTQTAQPPPMRPETRARLLEHFVEPNRQFHELTGMDLSRWNR